MVCGDPTCGKTSIVLRFTDHAFRRTYIPTIGVNITDKIIKINDKIVSLVLWDIAGQMKFKTMRQQFYLGSKAVLLLFDVTRASTFKTILNWYNDIKNTLRSEENLFIILCGNKIDLNDNREVNSEDAKNLASQLNFEYMETSALTGENVNQVFAAIAKKLMKNFL